MQSAKRRAIRLVAERPERVDSRIRLTGTCRKSADSRSPPRRARVADARGTRIGTPPSWIGGAGAATREGDHKRQLPPFASGPTCAASRRQVVPRRLDGQTNSGTGARAVLTALVCACEKRGSPGRKEVCPLPTKTIVIQLPNGDLQYDFTRETLPSVGDTLRRNGELWVVTLIKDEVVHVERVDEQKSR